MPRLNRKNTRNRKRAYVRWTNEMVNALRNHHFTLSNESVTQRHKLFAKKFDTTFYSAAKAYDKFVTNGINPRDYSTTTHDILSEKFSSNIVNTVSSNNFTLEEIITAQRWAQARGYSIIS